MSLRALQIAAFVAGCALLGSFAARAEGEEGGGMVAEGGADAPKKEEKKGDKGEKGEKGEKKEKPAKGDRAGHPLLRAIAEKEAELKLTEDQKKQIAELRKKTDAAFEDPEVRELQKQMMEARKAQDKEKMQALKTQLKAKIEAKGGMADDSVFAELKKILTEEQSAKINEKRGGAEGKGPEGKGGAEKKGEKGEKKREGKEAKHEEGKAADPAKGGPPPLYEQDKEAK